MKHNECSSAVAGNIINKSVTDMDIDTADAVEEKEHVHGIDAAGVVKNIPRRLHTMLKPLPLPSAI